MKSDIVLRIEKALKEYTPSKIDGVRIATARGILTAYEIAVLNGLSEAGKVDCIKVCESFLLPPITYGITNPEEHYITCEKKNYRGDVIKTFNLTGKKSPTSIGGAMNCPIVFFRRQSDIIQSIVG